MYNGFPLWRSNGVCECKPLEKVTRWLLLSQLFKPQPSCLLLYPQNLCTIVFNYCKDFHTGVTSRRTLVCYCCCCGLVKLLDWDLFATAVVVGFLRRIALFEVHWEERSLHFVQALSRELASNCLQAKSFLDSHFSHFLLSTPCDNKNACDMAITIVITAAVKLSLCELNAVIWDL